MSKSDLVPSQALNLVSFQEINGNKIPSTTSIRIAQIFEKRHDDVLKAVKNLIKEVEFSPRNFAGTYYIDAQDKQRPMYLLDETLTTVLLMGFNGKKSLRWKIAYAKEFQRLRQENRVIRQKGDDPSQLNELLNHILKSKRDELGKETRSHHYINTANAINETVFGESGNKKELRKNMTQDQYRQLNVTITKAAKAIMEGRIHKQEIKEYLTQELQ